jgi:hypothetical protein
MEHNQMSQVSYSLKKNKVEEQNPLKKTGGSFLRKALRVVETKNINKSLIKTDGSMVYNRHKFSMRNIMLILVVIMFGFSANAQSCSIQGSNDNSTVQVKSHSRAGSTITVKVINDSKDIMANVTAYVTVTYSCNTARKTKDFEGTNIALAGVSSDIDVSIEESFTTAGSTYKIESYQVKSISGKKCN